MLITGFLQQGFGYSDLTAQLFTAPNYAVQVFQQSFLL